MPSRVKDMLDAHIYMIEQLEDCGPKINILYGTSITDISMLYHIFYDMECKLLSREQTIRELRSIVSRG